MTNKQKLNKLRNIYADLGDDDARISTLNKAIQSVADDFSDLIDLSYCHGTKSKIEAMKEPAQSNDSNLVSARAYCQKEIKLVRAAMKKEG